MFRYDNYRIADDSQSVEFNYSLTHAGENFELTEQLHFPVPITEQRETQQALRGLHLALGISYYKIFIPESIKHPYEMDETEASFWNDVWKNGLGEFLFTNQLTHDDLAKFYPQSGIMSKGDHRAEWNDAAILGIGGGKDSIVAGELLKAAGVNLEGFVLATSDQLGQTQQVADKMGIPLHPIQRVIDPKMLLLNKRPDSYNGHVPISLVFALVGTVAAASLGSRYIVVANESSSSIPRVHTGDVAVNHQWSKSFEFESMFRDYVHKNISNSLEYFSAVRPLNSVSIAKLFATYPDYFYAFTSDNSVFKINPEDRPVGRWSLNSAKSLSSFILLSPWIDAELLTEMFGRDFLDEEVLEDLFLSLLGEKGDQPLDCVGTIDELRSSLQRTVNDGKFANSLLVNLAISKGLLNENVKPIDSFLILEPEDATPQELKPRLHDQMKSGLEL